MFKWFYKPRKCQTAAWDFCINLIRRSRIWFYSKFVPELDNIFLNRVDPKSGPNEIFMKRPYESVPTVAIFAFLFTCN